jgi:hypothetical protein
MNGTTRQHLTALPIGWGKNVDDLLMNFADRLGNQNIVAPGLVIKAGASPLVKAGNVFHTLLNGKIVSTAANTDMAALSGTVVNATFNLYAFFIDKTGVLTSAIGQSGATLSAVTFPPVPGRKACVGYIVVNPTGTGDFVGGTTALDNATVVPNVVYVNVIGPFDPTIVP